MKLRLDARKDAISNMLHDARTLRSRYGPSSTIPESELLHELSNAARNYAERARKLNGPTVYLTTTIPFRSPSHQELEHDDASQFIGAMSYALRINKLAPLKTCMKFKHEYLLASIANSVRQIDTLTDEILVAHRELNDTIPEQYDDPGRQITMTEEEFLFSQNLYKKAGTAEWKEEFSTAASRT